MEGVKSKKLLSSAVLNSGMDFTSLAKRIFMLEPEEMLPEVNAEIYCANAGSILSDVLS